MPDGARLRHQARGQHDVVMFFATRLAEFERRFDTLCARDRTRAADSGSRGRSAPRVSRPICARASCARSGSRTASSTTRCARSTTRGRVCGSSTASPTGPSSTARARGGVRRRAGGRHPRGGHRTPARRPASAEGPLIPPSRSPTGEVASTRRSCPSRTAPPHRATACAAARARAGCRGARWLRTTRSRGRSPGGPAAA